MPPSEQALSSGDKDEEQRFAQRARSMVETGQSRTL
jgi:hypothetical protein